MSGARIITVTLNPAVDRVLEAPGFHIGGHTDAKVAAQYPAGKGVNVSRVLGELGVQSIATGFVGRNELTMFEEHLERHGGGATVCQFLIVRARTRDNVTIVDPVEDTVTHLRDAGFTVQEEDVSRMRSKVGLLARRGSIVAFCGSLPPGLEASVFVSMVDRCLEQGARVVVDTSGDALRAVADRPIWLMKINEEELAALSGREIPDEATLLDAARASSVLGGGTYEHVVVTRQADGAVMFGKGEALSGKVSVHPGRIMSTVGSGDALLAGMLAEFTRSGDWSKALQQGLATATANAVNQQAGHIEHDDIEEFLAMSFLERLS